MRSCTEGDRVPQSAGAESTALVFSGEVADFAFLQAVALNESHVSDAASSEAAANSTFLEDLEKSLDADSDDGTWLVTCPLVSTSTLIPGLQTA